MKETAEDNAPRGKVPWYRRLHWQILVGIILGAVIGFSLNQLGVSPGKAGERTFLFLAIKGLGDVFLRLLKMIVMPLIAASIITGIGTLRGGGVLRLTARTIIWYMLTTCLAVAAGILLVNIIQPGAGLSEQARDALYHSKQALPQGIASKKGLGIGMAVFDVLIGVKPGGGIIPENIGKAVTDFKMLQVVFFSIFLGAMGLLAGKKAGPFFSFFDSLNEVMFKAAGVIIKLAPIAVMALLAKELWVFGFERLKYLGSYFVTVLLGLAFHAGITLPFLVWLFAKRSPIKYFSQVREALALAFSTASSGATLPVTMRCQIDNAGISKKVAGFVSPLGATVNMDGTALYEAVAAIFICNVTMPSPLTVSQQATVFLTAVLAAVGAAAIPHAGLVMMVIVLTAVGAPIEGIGLILAVDRLLDMCRTMVNVWGDCVCAAVVDRKEASFGNGPGDTGAG